MKRGNPRGRDIKRAVTVKSGDNNIQHTLANIKNHQTPESVFFFCQKNVEKKIKKKKVVDARKQAVCIQ